MMKLKLHSEETARKLGRAYTRVELEKIETTIACMRAWNALYFQRKQTKDANAKLAIKATMDEMERFIDVAVAEINEHFTKALDKSPKRATRRAA